MGVFYIGGREGRSGVFRRLCVGMILGCDFYWFGVGEGATCFSGEGEFGRGDFGCVLMYEFVMVGFAGGVSVLC